MTSTELLPYYRTEAAATVDALAQLSELRTQRDSLAATADRLTRGQLRGDDPRLISFWQEAHDVSIEEDWCEVYDRIVSAMRGPERVQEAEFEVAVEVSVRVPVTIYRTVMARNEDDACDTVIDDIGSTDVSDAMNEETFVGAELDWDIEESRIVW